MMNYPQTTCAVLKVGLWNGADTDWRGQLLYKALMNDALRADLRGGTVWSHVEGSKSSRAFRTVESEVASNELPVLLEFVDTIEALERFIPDCRKRIRGKGVMVVERGFMWRETGTAKGGETVKLQSDETRKGMDGNQRQRAERVTESAYDGMQVQIFTLEQSQLLGKPVYQAVTEFLRRRGILWISTARGITGFGELRQMRRRSWWFQKSDVPIVITVLDKVNKLEPCLPDLVDFVGHQGFVVSKPVIWHDASDAGSG